MDRVYRHLVTLLVDKFEVDRDLIAPGATLGELDLDSLAVVELYVTLQEEWDIALDDSTASADLTVDEVAGSVASLLDDPASGREAAR
ncbi:phosphopantetheine-binding protein [Streptomyces sp. NPDC020807]|uniref:acyl carrier protein n=1 Tax=Streptomyces sp. NPDC020807 TaxID=3155119 RepID=UPI0033C9D395